MCLLIISDFFGTLTSDLLPAVRENIRERINEARLRGRPIAFVHRRGGAGFESFGVRIGRYDPVFASFDPAQKLPSDLINFVVDSGAAQIRLTGIAEAKLFDTYREIFAQAGFLTHIDTAAIFHPSVGARWSS